MKNFSKAMLMMGLVMGTIAVPSLTSAQAAPAFMLDEYVVTATRTSTQLVDVPANVTVINAETIEKRNYQTVSEALANVPGVNLKRSGFAGGDQHVYLNGDDRVLVLVDGRRLNQDKGTSGRSGFDISNLPSPEFIERIEVLKGAGTSLYGSDAIGGVINIITKSANRNYVKLNANTGKWGTENYSAAVSAKVGRTGIYATASKQKQDKVSYKEADTGKNIEWPNSANDTTGATIKIDQEIGDDQLATLYFEHNFKDGGKPYYAVGLGGWNQVFPEDTGTDLNNNVSFKYAWNMDSDNAGYVQVYRNHYVGNFYQTTGNSYYYETKDGADLQQSFKLTDNNNLIFGAEWRDSEVNNPGTYGGKIAKINNKALFVQDSWNLGSSWLLNAGLRYDKHEYFGHETTASVALNKKFDETSHAYISWGQVFNAPQANDLFYVSPTMWGNPNLKPETGDVLTIGFYKQLDDKSSFNVHAFYSDLDDAIGWAAVDPAHPEGDWTVDNVAQQKKRGMEFSYRTQLDDKVAFDASYTYIKVEQDNKDGKGDLRDPNIPPNQYKFGFSYNNRDLSSELYARGATGASDKSYVESKYLTLDLSVQYKMTNDWKLYFKGYNLNNEAYAETGSISNGKQCFPAAGRTYIIGTEYTF